MLSEFLVSLCHISLGIVWFFLHTDISPPVFSSFKGILLSAATVRSPPKGDGVVYIYSEYA